MSLRKPWSGDLVMIAVVAVWALNNVVLKIALPGWLSPGAFNAVRFGLGALVLSAAVLVIEGSLHIPRRLLFRVVLLGLVGNGLCQMLFMYGLAVSPAGSVGVWLAITPLLVALMSGALGLEQVTWRIWGGALISAGGILLVLFVKGGQVVSGVGDLFLAGFVLTWAGYTVFSRPLVREVSPLRVTAVAMLVGAFGLVLWAVPDLLRQDYGAVPLRSWLGLLYAAVLSNATGYSLYIWSVRRIGAARVSLFQNLGPVLTALGAWLFLGEVWEAVQWLGATLVVGGVIFARWEDVRQNLAPIRSNLRGGG